MHRLLVPVFACALVVRALPARADSVELPSVRDNTLYESVTGNLSNGAGTGMFAGRTAQASNSRRRGLVRFDVAANVPAGSTLTAVTLTLTCTSPANALPVQLHRALANWGEGASDAGNPGGGGAPAAANDATWTFAFFNTASWVSAGGDFAPATSGSAVVAATGPVTFASTPALVADAQAWLDTPGANFGWLLLGNEASSATAVRFETHEAADAGVPVLHVEFTPHATPAPAASWGRVKNAYR